MKPTTIRLQPIIAFKTHQLFGYEVLSEAMPGCNNEQTFTQYSSQQLLQLRDWQLTILSRLPIQTRYFINLTSAVLACEKCIASLLQNTLTGVIELQDPEAISLLSPAQFSQLAININRLQLCGIEIWLDDYLSDYISTLRELRIIFDGVKIDRTAFQQYRRDVPGLKQLLNEARHFGSLVLTEGVEDEEDMVTAWLAGADLAQGFFWQECRVLTTA